MENIILVKGSMFYLCHVQGILKNDTSAGPYSKHCALFAYLKPHDNAPFPDKLKGIIADQNENPIPIAIHNDVEPIIREAFDLESAVLVRIQSVKSCGFSIVDGAVSLAKYTVLDRPECVDGE